MENSKPLEIEDVFIKGVGFANPKLKDLMTRLESIPDSFCAAGRLSNNQILYVSPSIETMLGYPMEHFLTQGPKLFTILR